MWVSMHLGSLNAIASTWPVKCRARPASCLLPVALLPPCETKVFPVSHLPQSPHSVACRDYLSFDLPESLRKQRSFPFQQWPNMKCSLLLLLGLAACVAASEFASPACSKGSPPTSVMPRWYHKSLPGAQLAQWVYDGISPFAKQAVRVNKNNMNIPLLGRGNENPLRQDPFGAGMRISSRYAYLGGKVCAWVMIPEPTSGTIFGMYLIDKHPRGSERGGAKWREADLEWLGWHPSEVQTSVFEQGQEQPNAQTHNTEQLLGASQRQPIRYCIDWDLQKPGHKYVKFTAKSKAHPEWVTIREWKPSSPDVDRFWNEPLRAIFTFWSNNHITGWSGPYSIPENKVIWGHLTDVTFKPRGRAFCPKEDNDLEPMS